jgi:hypothetical protein
MRRPVGLRVVADGRNGPAAVATNEVDREWIRQPLADIERPHRHASAARVDALETCTNDLGPAGPGCWRDAEPLERGAQFLGYARDVLRQKPPGLEGQVSADESDGGNDRVDTSVRVSSDRASLRR